MIDEFRHVPTHPDVDANFPERVPYELKLVRKLQQETAAGGGAQDAAEPRYALSELCAVALDAFGVAALPTGARAGTPRWASDEARWRILRATVRILNRLPVATGFPASDHRGLRPVPVTERCLERICRDPLPAYESADWLTGEHIQRAAEFIRYHCTYLRLCAGTLPPYMKTEAAEAIAAVDAFLDEIVELAVPKRRNAKRRDGILHSLASAFVEFFATMRAIERRDAVTPTVPKRALLYVFASVVAHMGFRPEQSQDEDPVEACAAAIDRIARNLAG